MSLDEFDPEVAQSIKNETERENNTLEMIASENFVSREVQEAQGSVMTNKYAEGYPGKRYYGGCEFVDVVENLAIERAKKIFSAEHVNVQPHSGSQANMAVYHTLLEPGDTILGMNLSHGGHLTHGCPVNFSGYTYNVVAYGVNEETELIDYEEVKKLAKEHKPKLIIVGASAYPRIIDPVKFREIADEVGAKIMTDIAHPAGLVAAGLYPSPVPYSEFVTTTTHKTLRGPRGGMILCREEFAKEVNKKIFPGIQGGPLMHVIAAKAVAFKEAMTPEFSEYQAQTLANARAIAKGLMDRGYSIVSGGTDNHLFLLDLVDKDITGKAADAALGAANITVNKNAVPNDPRSPFVTSGIRIGSPAVTSRGFKEAECLELAGWIADILDDIENDATNKAVQAKVIELCARFPVYPKSA